MLHVRDAILGRVVWIIVDVNALLLCNPSQQLLYGVVLGGQFNFELFQLGG